MAEVDEGVAVNLIVCVATELEGSLLRGHVPLLVTGVGAVNAAYSLTRYLDREGADAVVVCGIGGAYPGADLSVGSVAWAESECYGDLGANSAEGFLDMQALGFPLIAGENPVYNLLPVQIYGAGRRVPFVTVNACTGDNTSAMMMAERTGGGVESMEGAAFAHVARLFGVPRGEIRGISNPVGNRDRGAWRVKDAAMAAQEQLLTVFRSGSWPVEVSQL